MRRWLSCLLLALPSAVCGTLLSGCVGEGEGQLGGTLFLRGCHRYDPMPDSPGLPTPLPNYNLAPTVFLGEIHHYNRVGFISPDPRTFERMVIRLQRTAAPQDRVDGLMLMIPDLDQVFAIQEAALARGEPGVPVVPPDVEGDTAPLPGDPAQSVRASLYVRGSCRYPLVSPTLRGHVRFSAIARDLGEETAAEFQLTIEDARAIREQGSPPPSPDAAGALQGSFRFPLRAGPQTMTY